eukprot:144532_1
MYILNKIKTKRVKPFTKYKSLVDIYCKTYNISFQNMLLLRPNEIGKYSVSSSFQGRILKSAPEFDAKIQRNRALFIYNKTKIILLNNTTKTNMLSEIKDNQYEKQYHLTLLQYFDQNAQKIQNIQFLLLNKAT